MSAENVEIAKRAIDAFNGRDLDAYDDLFTWDFEWPLRVGGGATCRYPT